MVSLDTSPRNYIGQFRVVYTSPFSGESKAISTQTLDVAYTLNQINKQSGYESRVEVWNPRERKYQP